MFNRMNVYDSQYNGGCPFVMDFMDALVEKRMVHQSAKTC